MKDQDIRSTEFVASLGTEVSIQCGEERFKSILVGMQRRQYLIVRLPQPRTLGRRLQEGTDLILRYVHYGSVYGCLVTVRGLIFRPFPLVFLSYPDRVERVELRKVKRVECMIPAKAMMLQWEQEGMIRDISAGGVLFSAKSALDSEAPAFDLGSPIILSFPLLGMAGHQEFPGKIRRVNQDREELSLGVEFDPLPDEMTLAIETYVDTINAYQEN